jgi:hypothetical protein
MAKIINEIPEELEGEETEVELEASEDKQDYEEAAEAKKAESKKEAKAEPEFEIEEEDDTPPEDRGREPLPDEVKDELEKDNLEDYSARVKERMAQLKKAWHDERRAKEAEAREREEAIKYARSIIDENQRLKKTLSSGEEDYLKTLKEKYEADLIVAKRDYKEAYEAGDTDRVVEAQAKMSEAQFKLQNAMGRKPQYQDVEMPLQMPENRGQSSQQQSVSKPDSRALAWQEKNTWFGQDTEMTSLALGLHEKLVRSGVDPSSDEYYRRIDDTMQKRFPEYFGDDESLEGQPAQRTKKPSNVVAPATRSTSPKKVRLTKTQIALAKKFKLTPEQYAKELLKTENANG